MADIVYVDDEPDLELSADQKKHFLIFEYDEGQCDDQAFLAAKTANLWLFDFFLVHTSSTEERKENGLSLFNKWRGALNRIYPLVAVVSNDPETAFGTSLGPRARIHVQAEALGVEWVGDKRSPDIGDKLIHLAKASRELKESIEIYNGVTEAETTIGIERLCFDLLKAPSGVQWRKSVERQVDRARPPRITPPVSAVGATRLIIAWLLHQVLPFPSFLLNDVHAAIRLGVKPESFRDLIVGDSELSQLIANASYEGPLKSFNKQRWWRAGIDHIAWVLSNEEVGYEKALNQKAGTIKLVFLQMEQPVIVSDHDLVETDKIAEAKECLRAADDSFPQGVDPAWVRLSDAKIDHKLASKVIFEDQELLKGESS